jgi:hypothetical protein
MQKCISLLALTLFITSCTNTAMMENISQISGLSFTQDARGKTVLDKYQVIRDLNQQHNTLSLCIAQELDNKPVSLLGSSATFWDSYGGYYTYPGKSVSLEGGDTIKLIADNAVVAKGVTEYAYDNLSSLTSYVRYTLTATKKNQHIIYLFSHILQAKQDTGAAFNEGFIPVEVIYRAHPDYVIQALDKEIERIDTCLATELGDVK